MPPAALWTILGSVGIFVAFAFADGPSWVGDHVALGGAALRRGEIWTLASSLLIHLDARELLANGIGIWAFGAPLERHWGALGLVRFLVVVGVLANVATAAFALLGGPGLVGGLGASTLGLVVAWAEAFGHLRIGLFGSVIVARHLAYFVLGVALLGSFVSGSALHIVHLLAGVAAAWLLVRRRLPPPRELAVRFLRWRKRRRLPSSPAAREPTR